MNMRQMLTAFFATFVLLSVSPAQAQNARTYPWCAWYDYTTYNCGFDTYRQCLETISGVGGECRRNVRAPERPVPKSKKRQRHSENAAPVYRRPAGQEPARMIQLPNGRWVGSYQCIFQDAFGRYRDCHTLD